ncbi:hypothetical protein V6x_30010 [Gimesia chilikensis]|uniref:Uncharacterized protein n=1 Tax=Gimesia chilikensis TaxID=2605989 RepID=A0A517WDF1_9PLAN|nr:hypothetical protein [Gimesia chilikensis]QDU03289.1 hypothetical protein V6x_30010 [Gimesia chilikensis]
MREIMIGLMLAPILLVMPYLMYLQAQYIKFKNEVPRFRDEADIQKLKILAARQMRGTPTGLKIVNYFPFLIWLTGLVMGDLYWSDLFLYIVLPYLLMLAFCSIIGSPPVKIQKFEVADQSLESQRDHIVHVWIHETHPDW